MLTATFGMTAYVTSQIGDVRRSVPSLRRVVENVGLAVKHVDERVVGTALELEEVDIGIVGTSLELAAARRSLTRIEKEVLALRANGSTVASQIDRTATDSLSHAPPLQPPTTDASECSACSFSGAHIDMTTPSLTQSCALRPANGAEHWRASECAHSEIPNFLQTFLSHEQRMHILDVALSNTARLNCALEHLRGIVEQEDGADRVSLHIGSGLYYMAGGVDMNAVHNLDLTIGGCLDFGACRHANSSVCMISKREYGLMASFSHTTKNGFSNDLKPAISVCGVQNFSWIGGTIRGGGAQWYGPVNYALLGDERGTTKPILLDGYERCPSWKDKRLDDWRYESKNVRMENFTLLFAPYWNTYLHVVDGTIGHCTISSGRGDLTMFNRHAADDPASVMQTLFDNVFNFNTDGISIAGRNNWIHDCDINVGDDIVAVKGTKGNAGTTENFLVENIRGTGVGLTIGSECCARNVTFRNCALQDTVRAIYVKTNASGVLYDNITVQSALLFPIWIGPAYQGFMGSGARHGATETCDLTWPFAPEFITGAPRPGGEHIGAPPSFLCGGSIRAEVTLSNVHLLKSYTTPFITLGQTGKITIANVTIPREMTSSLLAIAKTGFAVSPNATCRFDAGFGGFNAADSPGFENCSLGGYPYTLRGASNGVSYCPGRRYPRFKWGHHYGVCSDNLTNTP
tara:strand:+ start:741 stop:2807 length:2067 start_codon:yes stop_codon:yes gene_type:complete